MEVQKQTNELTNTQTGKGMDICATAVHFHWSDAIWTKHVLLL